MSSDVSIFICFQRTFNLYHFFSSSASPLKSIGIHLQSHFPLPHLSSLLRRGYNFQLYALLRPYLSIPHSKNSEIQILDLFSAFLPSGQDSCLLEDVYICIPHLQCLLAALQGAPEVALLLSIYFSSYMKIEVFFCFSRAIGKADWWFYSF